jgi:hypothetical protein
MRFGDYMLPMPTWPPIELPKHSLATRNMITADYSAICQKCHTPDVKILYLTLHNAQFIYVCVHCLVKDHHGSFPKGKGSLVPCKLCKPPVVRWYTRNTYGKIPRNCGNHEEQIEEPIQSLFD